MEHCHEVGLWVAYITQTGGVAPWFMIQTSEFCLVINFLLLAQHCKCRLLDSFEHFVCAKLFLFMTSFGICTLKKIVAFQN